MMNDHDYAQDVHVSSDICAILLVVCKPCICSVDTCSLLACASISHSGKGNVLNSPWSTIKSRHGDKHHYQQHILHYTSCHGTPLHSLYTAMGQPYMQMPVQRMAHRNLTQPVTLQMFQQCGLLLPSFLAPWTCIKAWLATWAAQAQALKL